jgi:hypothetical protein
MISSMNATARELRKFILIGGSEMRLLRSNDISIYLCLSVFICGFNVSGERLR